MDTIEEAQEKLQKLKADAAHLEKIIRAAPTTPFWFVTVDVVRFMNIETDNPRLFFIVRGDAAAEENHGRLTARIIGRYPGAVVSYKRTIFDEDSEMICHTNDEAIAYIDEMVSKMNDLVVNTIVLSRKYPCCYFYAVPSNKDENDFIVQAPSDDKMMNVLVDFKGRFVRKWFG